VGNVEVETPLLEGKLLCGTIYVAQPQRAIARFTGQNGKVLQTKSLIANDCGKGKGKKVKKKKKKSKEAQEIEPPSWRSRAAMRRVRKQTWPLSMHSPGAMVLPAVPR
jgi:hypothetical protein